MHPELMANHLVGLAVEVEEIDAHRLVNEHDLLAVRRPLRPVAEARPELGEALLSDLVRGRAGFGVADRQLILPGAVAEIRYPFAVRRPRRVTLSHSRAARQIKNHAVLRWRGEDVPARLEQRPLAGRRY